MRRAIACILVHRECHRSVRATRTQDPFQAAMKTSKTKLVIFDLDGTLIDTAPDLAYSMDLVMRELHLPAQGLENVRSYIGHGVRRLVEDIVSSVEKQPAQATLERALDSFNTHYREHLVRESALYPGVNESLAWLQARGIKCACVTNKPGDFANPLLRHFQIEKYFDVVVSGDTLEKKKPDPFPLTYVCNQLGVETGECIMVGDSENDIEAARRAGIRSVCMSYGYTPQEDITLLKPDVVLDSCVKLKELV